MNPKIRALMLAAEYAALELADRAQRLVLLVAEYCANVCEEMGTTTAGLPASLAPTALADDCAAWIRKDFGIEDLSVKVDYRTISRI